MHATPEPALQVQGLRKAYGSRTAVESVSFQVQPGQVLGLRPADEIDTEADKRDYGS
jgi:ABC-type phosphonate transport system ATPase subunit